jgi:aspartate kinase
MIVFKFGGASVRDAAGIKNLAEIVSSENDDLAIVVSAFGKTTNALENVLKAWIKKDNSFPGILDTIYNNHILVASELFGNSGSIKKLIDNSLSMLSEHLSGEYSGNYDYEYDQIVSLGEIWSTIIVSGYLNLAGIKTVWIDIRENLITDERHRDANVLWGESESRIRKCFDFSSNRIYLTQGFIGGTLTGKTTTLGREGSDYTAAILGNILDAGKVVFWKDVPGVLNADPKWFSDVTRLEEISYKEAVEMTFSGAKVIHPKTIIHCITRVYPLM